MMKSGLISIFAYKHQPAINIGDSFFEIPRSFNNDVLFKFRHIQNKHNFINLGGSPILRSYCCQCIP
jgi:hypothetical protein